MARGVLELRNFGQGKKLSLKQSILAKCCDCMGNYADGKIDCEIPDCPLYPFMPYGVAWAGRTKRIVSPERMKQLRSGLKRGIK